MPIRCAFIAYRDLWGNAEDGARDRIRGRSIVVAGEIAQAQSEAMVMTTPVPSEERLRNRSKKGITGRYAPTRCEPALRASLETPGTKTA